MGHRNQTQSAKNSSNAFSPEIASCIWARFTQKNSSPNLAKKKWKTYPTGSAVFLFLETFCCSELLCQFFWRSDKLEWFYWTLKLSISSCFGDQLCSQPLKHGNPWRSGTKYGRGCVKSKEEGYQFCCIDNIRYS